MTKACKECEIRELRNKKNLNDLRKLITAFVNLFLSLTSLASGFILMGLSYIYKSDSLGVLGGTSIVIALYWGHLYFKQFMER